MSYPALRFIYCNYKGEIEKRIIDVDERPEHRMEYHQPGKNLMHPDGGWMISGICRVRKARRTFELKRIIGQISEVPGRQQNEDGFD